MLVAIEEAVQLVKRDGHDDDSNAMLPSSRQELEKVLIRKQ